MSSLGHFMQDLAEAMDVTFQVSEGVYSLEMPTPGGRSQVVNATTRESGIGGEMILFYTPVGKVMDETDWRSLLELNVGTISARVGIIEDYIVVVAGQMLDSADVSEVIAMLAEVGTLGDILENLIYGDDQF
jgi:hypothetical protein